MTQPFLGELRPFTFGFAPNGWALCDGQTLAIQQYTALFSLLGTTYGGNGINTFLLPDLRGRVPMHFGSFGGNTYVQGEIAGEEAVTLTLPEIPQHLHAFVGTSAAANVKRPVTGSAYAQSTNAASVSPGDAFYGAAGSLVALNPSTVEAYGQSQPHTNLQPYLVLSWCIALTGIFPSRN
jgi:microcystin-dependent protein